MEFKYIIVQAGGLGTRLGKLTSNKPKSLVSVLNRPILFHLFEKYPDRQFIIIGDYKYDVLDKYLRVFAKVDYLLVHAHGKGNAAGLKDALYFVPDDEPFMVIWSDLILADDWKESNMEASCYVGVTNQFPCSWRMKDGMLKKTQTKEDGVAGCFVFDKKERLLDLPPEGSFTKWLSESRITLDTMDMGDSMEAGTEEAIRGIDPGSNRCRPYNHMEFTADDKVIKTGLTDEGRKLIEREVRWYERVSEYGFHGIPEIFQLSPLTMKRIHGTNIYCADLDEEEKKRTIERLVGELQFLHQFERVESDYFGLEEDYYTKTLKRLHGIREVIPFSDDEYILINGRRCRNVLRFTDEFHADVREHLFDTEFGPIHGDCTLTNSMIDENGNIYFIDARGYFGKRELFGDVYYDWAKLYYSINGCFDQFNVKNFNLSISDNDVSYSIGRSGWEHLTDDLLSKIKNVDVGKIKLIHAIVWLSLASHCWEDYDSMCLAFYNGLCLWDEWINEYRE